MRRADDSEHTRREQRADTHEPEYMAETVICMYLTLAEACQRGEAAVGAHRHHTVDLASTTLVPR